ncbi:MAG TPA: hypothetical protein VGD99_10860, partial [Anaerolineae bacterium]
MKSYLILITILLSLTLSACGQTEPEITAATPAIRFVTVTPGLSSPSILSTTPATPERPGLQDTAIATGGSANQFPSQVHFSNVAQEAGLNFRHGAFRWGLSGDPAAMMGGGLC